ncbi:hypothetical protein [Streptomyces sp. NPDC056821]|uniref:hypothetical protein n=1 Tax=unclassified Streptomyces TaxID=2593676 RepID=UPI0036BC6321
MAVISSVAMPGVAVFHGLPIPSRIVLAALGLLAWISLFKILKNAWGDRIPFRGQPDPSGWAWVVFTASFYAHGLVLGLAWREYGDTETGLMFAHVVVSAILVAIVSVASRRALFRATDGCSTVWPVLGMFGIVLALLWPAMAVWHFLAGPAGQACELDAAPSWWPVLLPIG